MNDGHDIFISYSREDRARVGVLAEALEREGWRVWWDRKLMPGDTFDRVITEALAAAKVVVAVWSRISVDRDWVLNEADEGRRRNILVPVRIDPVDIPLGFRRVQAADLSGWKGEQDHPELINLFAENRHAAGSAGPAAAVVAREEEAQAVGGKARHDCRCRHTRRAAVGRRNVSPERDGRRIQNDSGDRGLPALPGAASAFLPAIS